jgi:hypothetical protein
MKKTLIVLAITILAFFVLAGGLLAQKKPGFLGAWTGFAIIGDGSRVDNVSVTFAEGESGYTGKLAVPDMIPEALVRNIVFKDGKLSFDFDLWDDMGGSQLIRIELMLDQETLKGHWFDAEGNSDIIELTLKK